MFFVNPIKNQYQITKNQITILTSISSKSHEITRFSWFSTASYSFVGPGAPSPHEAKSSKRPASWSPRFRSFPLRWGVPVKNGWFEAREIWKIPVSHKNIIMFDGKITIFDVKITNFDGKITILDGNITILDGNITILDVHVVVARNTCPSQNVQSTPASDHFWKLRCRKSARWGRGAKHIFKSTYKTHHVRIVFEGSDVVLPGRHKGFCTLPKLSKA